MSAGSETDRDPARSERAIRTLADASGASPEKVRDLFTAEFTRLERVAKIRTYLHVLTTVNVRTMLSRARSSNRHVPDRGGSADAAGMGREQAPPPSATVNPLPTR